MDLAPREDSRRRNEQWDGLETVFGYRPIGAEAKLWGSLALAAAAHGFGYSDFSEAAARWAQDMPEATMTPPGLVKHMPRLLSAQWKPPPGRARPADAASRTLALARQAALREVSDAGI